MKDLYEILEVERGCSQQQIKDAYRKRAKQTHPDANRQDPEAEERFKEVNSAYDILGDEDKRRAYDEGGCAEAAEQGLTRIEVMLKSTIAEILRRASPTVNLIDALRGVMSGAIETKRDEMRATVTDIARLKNFLGKHERADGGTNLFELTIQEAIGAKELQLAACRADMEDARDMHAYLNGYRYKGNLRLGRWDVFERTDQGERRQIGSFRGAQMDGQDPDADVNQMDIEPGSNWP